MTRRPPHIRDTMMRQDRDSCTRRNISPSFSTFFLFSLHLSLLVCALSRISHHGSTKPVSCISPNFTTKRYPGREWFVHASVSCQTQHSVHHGRPTCSTAAFHAQPQITDQDSQPRKACFQISRLRFGILQLSTMRTFSNGHDHWPAAVQNRFL